jgi:hypothetical protein
VQSLEDSAMFKSDFEGRHGQTRVLAALISIRNEQVYILQADATRESFEAARQALAEVADGWVWTR